MKLLVYVPLLTPRIAYIFNFIFNDLLKTEVGFCVSIEEFVQSDLPKFCYAPQPIAGELFFKSTALLLEHKITAQQIKTTSFGEIKVPFPVEKSTLPFDVFASAFYFLSRYEEYAEDQKNIRYEPEFSLQYKLELLQLPVIDGWALILKNILLKHFPKLSFGKKDFSFIPVYFSYSATIAARKNRIVSAISYVKSLLNGSKTKEEEKLRSIRALIGDIQQHEAINKAAAYVSIENKKNHLDAQLLIPKSYLKLTKNKAGNDYSMFYDNQPGFRAGTCTSFQWYDLQLEKKTQLMIHPISTVDIALLAHQSVADLLLQMNELIDNVKLVNGSFYFLSLRHNFPTQ